MEECIHKCSICGNEFKDKLSANVTKKLKQHLKSEHDIDYYTYILNTFHDGINPVCSCGCGEKLRFIPKNSLFGEGHGFTKFVSCTHVGRNRTHKNLNTEFKWDDKDWVVEHYNTLYGLDNIKSAFIDFMDGRSASDVSNDYGMHIRTMKGAWVRLGLITHEKLKSESMDRQRNVSGFKRRKNFDNSEMVCEELFDIIKKNPQKYNIRSLIRYYNKINHSKLEVDPSIVNRSLIEHYGENVYNYLQFGSHSKEELEFLSVLQYYFSKYKIVCGKKLYYGKKNKREYYSYDFCLGKKLIIEYDGNGYYHSDEKTLERDKEKEEFALKNGYVFMRLSLSEAKNIDLLTKIKKILEDDRIY